MGNTYSDRGVSAGKEDVHAALEGISKGLYTDTFCKVLPDLLGNREDYASILHADTAGTKSVLAYLYWKETGDLSIWRNLVMDALVMNLDDMACTGLTSGFLASSILSRNKNLISAEVVKAVIQGGEYWAKWFSQQGVNLTMAGGETADVGDVVRTVDLGFTLAGTLPKKDIIRIAPKAGDVIVGFASDGQATYEDAYNSGIGCNGLTFARHEVLSNYYTATYPESFDPSLKKEVVYTGKYLLRDTYEGHEIGSLLLSPTRTYLPLIVQLIKSLGSANHGLVHNTGGGQTKVLHYLNGLRVIKDNLPKPPTVFNLIQEIRDTPLQEMYQVFNMGTRLEMYLPQKDAPAAIEIAKDFNIDAWTVGYFEEGEPEVQIRTSTQTLSYPK